MRILLDTCTFLWLAEGDDALSPRARDAIIDPSNQVFLSPISAWEIVVKHALGRLELRVAPERYVPEQRELHRIESLPLSELAVLQVAKLPPLHKDPFDRMLAAQSVAEACAIATPDPLLRQYSVVAIW